MECVRQALHGLFMTDSQAFKLYKSIRKALFNHVSEVRTVGQLLGADFFCYVADPLDPFIQNLGGLKAI